MMNSKSTHILQAVLSLAAVPLTVQRVEVLNKVTWEQKTETHVTLKKNNLHRAVLLTPLLLHQLHRPLASHVS